MWGSTKANAADECTWEHAPFNNGSDSCDEEYFNAHKSEWLDDDNNLKPEFDAATQIMGGNWRMPTKGDIQELLYNTDNKWTQVNGVNGFKFTGSNGNSIFIPAAGYRSGSWFADQGDHGNVWSSSLYTLDPYYAWGLYFYSDGCNVIGLYRYGGRSVRGVMK